MASKVIRKEFPAIPTAPLAERAPDLNIPDSLFDGCSSIKTYSSRPFNELDDFESYVKDLYKAVREIGKGETLFQDESQFLNELDSALLHYEMYRPIVTPEICGTFKEQREYFLELNKALKIKKPSSRLKKVQGNLKEITECHLRRLSKAKFNIAACKRIKTASLGTSKSPDKNLIKDLDKLNVAVDIVRSDLKGKNAGYHAELYLLIEQLADMYENCTGEKPPKTVNTYEEDKDKGKRKNKSKEKGIFFKMIKSIHTVVHIANQPITDSAIFEGIRLLK